jgi:hypothetical protein
MNPVCFSVLLGARHFWHRKGDVFHLLLNMALVLDDRWARVVVRPVISCPKEISCLIAGGERLVTVVAFAAATHCQRAW